MEKIKTYTLNWGDGNLILDEQSFIEYITKGAIFDDEDIKREAQEVTVTIEYKYTQEELEALPEFDF
jgi:hypothetical protein